jgi:molybdopterin converting factor small subunit
VKVSVKVFPAAGLCERRRELEIALEEGSMRELEERLFGALGADPLEAKALMFLLNGRGIGRRDGVVFKDGDQLWLLPQVSGG